MSDVGQWESSARPALNFVVALLLQVVDDPVHVVRHPGVDGRLAVAARLGAVGHEAQLGEGRTGKQGLPDGEKIGGQKEATLFSVEGN